MSQWREKSLYYPLESLPSHLGGAAKPHTGPSGQDALHMSSTGLYKGLAAQSVFFFYFKRLMKWSSCWDFWLWMLFYFLEMYRLRTVKLSNCSASITVTVRGCRVGVLFVMLRMSSWVFLVFRNGYSCPLMVMFSTSCLQYMVSCCWYPCAPALSCPLLIV